MGETGSPKTTILIVDDTPFNVRFLADILTREGYATHTAADGYLALEEIPTLAPDLILLDIMMPGLSGYDVCTRLKADERTRDIPIIFLSALNQELDKVQAFAVGGVDYITKPFQVKEVMARIETHLSLRRLQKHLEESNTALQREITERIRAEQSLRHYAGRLRILLEITQSILAARSPETIAIATIGRIRELIPCQRAIVIAMTESQLLKILAAESERTLPLAIDEQLYRELFDSPALRAGRVQGIPDLAKLPAHSPLQAHLLTEELRSYLVVPLLVDDDLVGTLHLEAREPGVFDTDHVTIATEIAALLAVAIRQARLYELSQQEIVERKLVEETLRQQTVELEARNVELDAFAHTVAHDLKTPLTAVVGFSDLLQRRHTQMPAGKLSETLGIIAQNGLRMANIINELLLLASVRRMDEVPVSALNMARIVTAARDRLGDMFKERAAQLSLPETWPIAYGYGPWVEEVWINYLSNAIKYGGTPPQITVGATPQTQGIVRFWVHDNGSGLTLEEQSHLFTEFTRLHRATAVEGHGLGLSIVQRIVTRLQGEVGIESTVGEGSTFFFTLPFVLDTEGSAAS